MEHEAILFFIYSFFSSCGKLVFTMGNHKSPVLALALSRDVYLASGARNGVTLVTNIVSGEVLQTLKGHTGSVTALAITEMEGYAPLVLSESLG